MATMDPAPRHRDALPSINDLDFEKGQRKRGDNAKYPMLSGLSISTAPLGSPTTIYSGPPPPYTYTSSNAGSTHHQSGYISPPESSRRSTRDDKESPGAGKSLPSIHEALGGDKGMNYSSAPLASTPTSISHPPGSAPLSALGQSFPDAPKGPPNPFSQPAAPASAFRDSTILNQSTQSPHIPPPPPDAHMRSSFAAVNEHSRPPSHAIGASRSPIPSSAPSFAPTPQSYTNYNTGHEMPAASSPGRGMTRASFAFHSQFSNPQPAFANSTEIFHFEGTPKMEHQGTPYAQHDPTRPYGESVKRQLDIFDAELALNEIAEASDRTLNFARIWAQRSHQNHRTSYFPEALPGLHELEDMMRQSTRVMENLSRLREVANAQQNILSEQRARAARGDHMDDYDGALQDEYKGSGGYTGGDAKKRRGKAAPPGRCHSCNRAETPEWRRGPDGARTLCNACGLHYAKLTRKMGVNKAAALTGSNLRPKNPDQRMTTQL